MLFVVSAALSHQNDDLKVTFPCFPLFTFCVYVCVICSVIRKPQDIGMFCKSVPAIMGCAPLFICIRVSKSLFLLVRCLTCFPQEN